MHGSTYLCNTRGSPDIHSSLYSFPLHYRQFCLLRYILQDCNCYYAKTDGPVNRGLLPIVCGHLDNPELLVYPEEYNGSHCLQLENMVLREECRAFYEKLFHDLVCVQKMKRNYMSLQEGSNGMDHKCQCPEPCEYFSFNTFYSLAKWPSEGPELDVAYHELIVKKIFPRIQGNNTTPKSHYDIILQHPIIKEKLVEYLSNKENKKEILSHFQRLTVYVKDLTIETIEDIEGYSRLDLISDIGK